ncbi:muscarinic acetylcholine receptor M3-like [Patiria miniata]|uniref:G-protein coupled receptors family 1 profile domain-containing protein n=1 Tax=Patiria miniata TaxID=46514 RepID=A0A914BS17_PATMI|nr:muscarinic acetylcholine receptor M3-like [Patiria miniata]
MSTVFSNLSDAAILYLNDTTAASPSLAGEGWPTPVQVIVGTIVAAFTLVTILGNTSVIYAFLRSSRLRSYNNYYIVSLAVADLIVGLTTMPMYGLYWFLGYWPLGHVLCSCHLVISHFILNTTFLSVLAIAIDRFMSVTYPIFHIEHRTRRCALVVISLTYIVPLSIWLPFLLYWEFVYDGPFFVLDYRCYPLYLSNLFYTTGAILVLNWIPIFAVMVVYFKVYRSVRGKIARRRERLRALHEAACRQEVDREDTSPESALNARMVPPTRRDAIPTRTKQGHGLFMQMQCGALCGIAIASDSHSSDEADYRLPDAWRKPTSDTSEYNFSANPMARSTAQSSSRQRSDPRYWLSPNLRRSTAYTRHEESNLALRTLSLIVISMMISGLPWAITAVVIVICRYCIPLFVQQMLVFLVHTSSAVNPFCYAAANPLYRMAFLNVLNLACYRGTNRRHLLIRR